ncbi:hypothetical protein Mapa_009945 [Marchantia paleacea]|nr:hypothetical protein Mapa_009945 [Marchantia paleacea]
MPRKPENETHRLRPNGLLVRDATIRFRGPERLFFRGAFISSVEYRFYRKSHLSSFASCRLVRLGVGFYLAKHSESPCSTADRIHGCQLSQWEIESGPIDTRSLRYHLATGSLYHIMGGRSDEASLSHYEVLGADPSADYVEIRAKYRAAVLAFHPDRFSSSCFDTEGAKSQNLGDECGFSLGSSGNVDRRIREVGVEFTATYRSKEQSNEPEQFLRVQKAWEILRDSNSRATYDQSLSVQRLAHQQEESTEVIGEEVCIEDMELNEGEEGLAVEYTYPCRCGDLFLVSPEELNEAGFTGMTCPRWITETCKNPEPLKVQTERSFKWQRHSLILPCQSCSLHIRLHLAFQYA